MITGRWWSGEVWSSSPIDDQLRGVAEDGLHLSAQPPPTLTDFFLINSSLSSSWTIIHIIIIIVAHIAPAWDCPKIVSWTNSIRFIFQIDYFHRAILIRLIAKGNVESQTKPGQNSSRMISNDYFQFTPFVIETTKIVLLICCKLSCNFSPKFCIKKKISDNFFGSWIAR